MQHTFRRLLCHRSPVSQTVRKFSVDADRQPVIVSFARTPIASFQSKLASITAPRLGAIAIKEAVARAIQEVFMGNVVSAGVGQAPATQAVLFAGLTEQTPATTINKVCASGMKAIMFASQSIMLGAQDIIVAGGMESMSNVPYYSMNLRTGNKLGNVTMMDGVLRDGLMDAYSDMHMGNCAEKCAEKYSITREQQDSYALESYARANKAQKEGLLAKEIVSVTTKVGKNEVVVTEDEEPKNLRADKISTLRAAFEKNGTVTAANSSKLNDAGVAMVIMSQKRARELGLSPLAKIIGFADAQRAPVEFTTAPADAIPKALSTARLSLKDVDFMEINEAFSVVSIANANLMKFDMQRLNVWGGAVALGHPIGVSGARIVGTLANILHHNNARIGVASICNGGGGASAVVIERI